MSRFFLVFLLLSAVFFWLLSLAAVQPAIDGFCGLLAKLSFFLVHLFDSDITLTAAILRHGTSGFALEVTEACSALSVCALWCAATLAYPLSWSYRAMGLLLGLLLIQSVNVLRLISLLYLGDWLARPQFDVVHVQVWPLVLHLFIIIGFAVWLWWGLDAPVEADNHATSGC